jgi:transcriptional regulator with XRE-family HTH domain
MSIIEELASRPNPEETLYYDWQFSLARRISQIMEERGMSREDFVKQTGLTEAEVDNLLHCGSDPTLSTLARISALLDCELLEFVNTDKEQHP